MSKLYDDLYLCSESEFCARLACGGVIELINEILLGKIISGFALVRPPGHHAEANQAMGFCIFNNVAVAVASLKERYNLNRILIVDWDVHYGNGIQKAFDSDPDVVYVSLHRYENAQFYPFDRTGALGYVGEEGGLGSTINVAWTRAGMGDGDYLYAFDEIVIPIAKEFDPEIIVVAAGFDAAEG
ncbi:Arginase/deacetylase, partial [Conidiobolus coronatus NRRL 28638]